MSATPHPPIPEPAPGGAVTAAWARAVVRTLRSMRLRSGPGVRVQTLPDGTTVSADPGRIGVSGREIYRATLREISGRASSAQARPLSARGEDGGARTVEIWALDLADEAALSGRYDVIAFPVARMAAESPAPEPEEEEEEE